MIKKLRIKLIAASMISLLVVLLVIEGIVGILNYRKMVGDADRILDVLEENSGRFPQIVYFRNWKLLLQSRRSPRKPRLRKN